MPFRNFLVENYTETILPYVRLCGFGIFFVEFGQTPFR